MYVVIVDCKLKNVSAREIGIYVWALIGILTP
jgi:hypothetical protein